VRAARNYVPRPYAGRLIIFRSAERKSNSEPDETLGWGRLAAQVEIHAVPGHHMFLLTEPYVAVIAERLRLLL